MIGFVGLIIVVVGLIHLYLWKRLVRDPLGEGRARRIGGAVAVVLALLAPATLVGVRSGHVKWLAWPGYLWIALMFYLLVTLAALEIPRLAASLWLRRREGSRGKAAMRATGDDAGHPRADSKELTAGESGADVATVRSDAGAEQRTDAGSAMPSAEGGAESLSGTASAAGEESLSGASGPSGAETLSGAASPDVGGASGAIGAESLGGAGKPSGVDGPPVGDAQGVGVERRLVLARGVAIFAGLTAAGVTGYGVRTALGRPRVDRVVMPLAKLSRGMDGTRLAVVSDIHLGPLTGIGHTQRIVEVINSVDADIVCVVGDLVDGSVAELGDVAAPLAGIRSRRGAYFVTGNHEYYSGYREWIDEVGRLGVRPLRNERLELAGLDLAGVNDLGGAEVGDGPDFERALGDRDLSRPVVLMAHQPIAARDAAPYGVDLQVSGHTHGGQMAPFNLLVKLQQPVVSGFGEVDGVPVYVTNGAGFWGPPVRVGAPPQVTVIELRTK